ncbi:iron hydrogenase [Baffinella frigidus]|nr:iron hydrogenase [Cryptophyta sp. CCMP2293]
MKPSEQWGELRFASVYGFRHIQNLVAQIKRGECEYDYVEVMACPRGCTNGGGQVRAQAIDAVNRNFDEWFGGESAEEDEETDRLLLAAAPDPGIPPSPHS